MTTELTTQQTEASTETANSGKPPPLVRPDRQHTFRGAPHWEWPAPFHDRDTLTVDRIRDDIDGPSHRFTICRGDTVEVFFSKDREERGQVVGISHTNDEVQVRFADRTDGIWFHKGAIYPAIEHGTAVRANEQPLSKTIAELNGKHGKELTETDRVPETTSTAAPSFTPYTFDDFKAFHREFSSGGIPFEEYHHQFKRLLQSQDAIQTELRTRFKATQLTLLAARMGSWDAKRATKNQNAASIVRHMLSSFVLDGTASYSMHERYEDAVAKKVLALTKGEYYRELEKQQEASLERERALENPETLSDFRSFILAKGEHALSDEQLAMYDSLHADATRSLRATESPKTIAKFQTDELAAIEFQVKEGFHDKRKCPLWIVQLSTRVEREAFNELNRKAKMLGGWFSSFKKSDAGFQFLEQDQAHRFCSLLQGDVDRTDILESRKERKELTAAERLHELATELFARAEHTIEQSNNALQNTARRAEIQSGVRGRAYADQAMSRTLHSIAEALSCGEAKYLDGIRHRTQANALDTVLQLAKWARVRALTRQEHKGTNPFAQRLEEESIGPATIRFAEFPYPWIYKRHLQDLIETCRHRTGVAQSATKMHKELAREKDDYVTFSSAPDIEALSDFLDRAKSSGVDVERVASSLEKYKRLERANIKDIHELRAALREYLGHRTQSRGDDPVQIAERELIGKSLPGFFPTPRAVIQRMLELAKVEACHRVLEPSCGKGDILDALQDTCPGIELLAIEWNRSLADVLAAKGHHVQFADFLEHHDSYDRIVMNPPFENGSDMLHVQHAYRLLSPQGRLVSVMSEGPFFRNDKKATEFRAWLDEVGGETEQLPEDAFQGRDAFRQTGVRTRLVMISKEEL